MFARVFFALALVPAVAAAEPASESSVAIDHRGSFARPIEQVQPMYPSPERSIGKQGWVQLSYVIGEDGRVIDPIIEDSHGGERFERSALRAVRNWRFEPATWDGEPVQQCQNEVMLTFMQDGSEPGVTPWFFERYGRADEALNAGDLTAAEALIEEVSEHSLTAYELARRSLLQARVAEANDDADAQLMHLRRVVAGDGEWIDADIYPGLLYVILVLEIETSRHSAALRTWERLSELEQSDLDLTPLQSAIDTLNAFVAGPEVISVPAVLDIDDTCEDCSADWLYYPLRRQIAFREIDGTIDNLDIRCDWKRVVDDVADNKTWEIPESWGNCRIVVTGEPGTSFTLIELPS